jgi:hypothetical protein
MDEFQTIAESSLGPMAQSEDFKADLTMQKSCWFYHVVTMKRCLILIHKPKDKATFSDLQKTMRALGK